MATKSILKNITLKNKKSCQNFASALEQAHKKHSVTVKMSKRTEDIKRDQIKAFFGER